MTFKKLKIELLCGPEILVLSIYLKEMKTITQKDLCTTMFIASIIWIEITEVSIDGWMDKETVVCSYVYGILLKILQFATIWLKLEGIMLSRQRKTNIVWSHLHMESKNKNKKQAHKRK